MSRLGRELKQGATRAYISAVAWKQLEEQVRQCFSVIKGAESAGVFGNFYLNAQKHQNQPVNHLQIHCGNRVVGYDENKVICERGAGIVFSQHVSGSVLVLLYPYCSDVSKTNEQYIILARYSSATNISKALVVKSLKIFLRYSKATSVHGGFTSRDYIFRLKLQWKSVILKIIRGPIPKTVIDLFKS